MSKTVVVGMYRTLGPLGVKESAPPSAVVRQNQIPVPVPVPVHNETSNLDMNEENDVVVFLGITSIL